MAAAAQLDAQMVFEHSDSRRVMARESSTSTSLSKVASASRAPPTSATEASTEHAAERQTKTGLLQKIATRDNARFAACCWQALAAGWNDACAGALIPYMERFYDVDFIQVSTLFIGAFFGFVAAGALNNMLTDRLGMGKVVTMGAAMQMAGYAVILAPPPFPLFPVTYAVLIGFGIALQMAQTSAYVVSLPDASIRTNYTQAAYGVGALLSPLCATALVTAGVRFSYFFAVSMALSAVTTVVMFLTFWRDPAFGPITHTSQQQRDLPATETPTSEAMELRERNESNTASDFATPLLTTAQKNRALLRSKEVGLCALFLFFYVGAEVSLGGWSVSFLMLERGGDARVGYVSTGFFTGITIGRLTLPRVQAIVGDTICLYIYISLSILLELSVWFWRSLIGNAVAICLIGFLLSTFFGIVVLTLTKLIPKHLHTGAIGLLAAAGQAGSAAFHISTGAFAQRYDFRRTWTRRHLSQLGWPSSDSVCYPCRAGAVEELDSPGA